MKKSDVVKMILKDKPLCLPVQAKAFAPTNIALCKYWGKRDQALNLPMTSSLSISLGDKGAETLVGISKDMFDTIRLNGKVMVMESQFYQRLQSFLNLFRPYPDFYFDIETHSNVPVAAGFASSACGFASVVLALNVFFSWNLADADLSILARLGSGSACRSIWQGFVEWKAGIRDDGMDSYGECLDATWPELCVGLLKLNVQEKPLSSREAMQRTIETSDFYQAWPNKVEKDLPLIKKAIFEQDFDTLGRAAESNALAMHATMQSAWPPIYYALPETLEAMRFIWQLRADGLPVYFTQDAGPNIKLLFLEKNSQSLISQIPDLEVIKLFHESM